MEECSTEVSHGPGAIFCTSSALYLGYHFFAPFTEDGTSDLSR